MRTRFGLILLALASALPAAEPPLRVPPGFTVARAAPVGAVRFPMFGTFDERGRLFVAESAGGDLYEELKTQARRCRISVLEDRDRDGVFETAQVFAEELVCPMGIAWRDGKLFVADAPDLITLEDTDGDGRADRRTVVLTGFGHTDNGSLHGLTFGPDGWFYFTMGEPDGYRLRRADGSWLEGTSGALFRSRADGSEIEVVARGFGNLVEVAFLPAGEIIGTDNWFQLPADGIRDALVHLLPGGLYPYAPDRGTAQPVTGAPLPALALYPAVAHSGIVRARFGAMSGSLFSAQFNARKIIRHQLTRHGATFRAADEDFVWTDDPDFHPSDVLEAADGSLLIVDTGSWYIHHCPTGAIRQSPAPGGIYRVRANANAADIAPSAEDAAWALARENSAVSRAKLRALLGDADADVVARAARALGRCGDREAVPVLVSLVEKGAPHVALAAAEALAECGDDGCVAAVLARLAGDVDRFLGHALIFVLHRRATTAQLAAALDRASPRVQQAVLRLLDQRDALSVEAVVRRVSAEDPALRETAQTLLRQHGEWSAQAVPVVRQLLARPAASGAEIEALRGFVVAFAGQPEIASLVAEAIGGESRATEPLRVALLETFARVPREKLPASWRGALVEALRSGPAAPRSQALRTVHALRLDGLDAPLTAIARDTAADDATRVEALRALVRGQPVLDAESFAVVLRLLARSNAALIRLAAAEVACAARLDGTQFAQFAAAVQGDPMISPASVIAAAEREPRRGPAADALLDYLRASVQAGWQLSTQQLVALEAALAGDSRTKLQTLREAAGEASRRQRAQLETLTPLLQGGDAARGRVIYETKAACAACHRVGGSGGVLGPDLTKIGAIRAGRDLIESIVMPGATFAQGYETYTVGAVTGIRVRQPDDAFVLRDASGAETRIAPAAAATAERLKFSLMPEGLLAALSEMETRDLFAYLQSLK